jgi:hypothetical protein
MVFGGRLLPFDAVEGVTFHRKARAGVYAHAKYERGLRAYRRRLRTPLLIVSIPMVLFVLAVMATRKLDAWSVAVGATGAIAIALVIFTRDDPPQHVVNWGRGAAGERKTERALRPLERNGWKVEHDIQRDGRANLDHVVTGPPGVFLLETKNLSGTITVEDGVLVARQFDDPDEVYRYTSLAPRLRGQAKELSARLRADTGRGAWVTAVAVIWGHFPTGEIEHENVVYIRGDGLAEWLGARHG